MFSLLGYVCCESQRNARVFDMPKGQKKSLEQRIAERAEAARKRQYAEDVRERKRKAAEDLFVEGLRARTLNRSRGIGMVAPVYAPFTLDDELHRMSDCLAAINADRSKRDAYNKADLLRAAVLALLADFDDGDIALVRKWLTKQDYGQ